MEQVKIPRLKVKYPEYKIVLALEVFTESTFTIAAGRECHPKVLKSLGKQYEPAVPKLNDLFEAVRSVHLSVCNNGDRTQKKSDQFRSQNRDFRLPISVIEKDRTLRNYIKDHESLVKRLRRIQKNCWISRDKTRQYANMVFAAKVSLQNRNMRPKGRRRSLQSLQDELSVIRSRFAMDTGEYHDVLASEGTLREAIIKLSTDLERQTCESFSDAIGGGLKCLRYVTGNRSNHQSTDPDDVANSLYDVICRRYIFSALPEDLSSEAFNKRLSIPRILPSPYEALRKQGSHT